MLRPLLPGPSSLTEQALPQGKGSPLLLIYSFLNVWEKDVRGVLVHLLLNSCNNFGNNMHLFSIDKWLQTTEGATEMTVLKEPGTSWNQMQAKRHSHLVDSSRSHGLGVLPKIQIKKKNELSKRRGGERKERPECLSRTKGKAFMSRTLRNRRLPSKHRHTSFPPVIAFHNSCTS